MPITPVVTVGNAELQLKFLLTKIPLDLVPNFATNLISNPLLTTFMLGTRIDSTPMVVITALNDWIIPILAFCLQVSTITNSDIIGGIVLSWDQ